MKIYYQYSTDKTLAPTGGDFVSEIGIMTALSRFAEVYYSGTRFDPTKANYGLVEYPGSIASRMLKGRYDVYYVRANKGVFLTVPKGRVKLWVGSPFDIRCYREATAVVTYTEAWAEALRKGTGLSWLPAPHVHRKFPNAVTVHQVVGDAFRPRQGHLRTKKIRKRVGGGFVVGYFGRLSPTNHPYSLVRILPHFVKKYPGVRFLFGLTKAKKALPRGLPRVVQTRFSHAEMPYVTSACDLVAVLSSAAAWSVSGCMKVIEAAACGVPVLLPFGQARAELFGEDYVYFLPPLHGGTSAKRLQRRDNAAVWAMLEMVMQNKSVRQQVARELPEKAKFYTVAESAKRLERLFKKLVVKNIG